MLLEGVLFSSSGSYRFIYLEKYFPCGRAANNCAPTVNSNLLAPFQTEKLQNCTMYDFRNKGPQRVNTSWRGGLERGGEGCL